VLVWKAGFGNHLIEAQAGSLNLARLSRNADIEKRILAQRPKGLHLIVDTSRNILILKNGEHILRESVVSTGSGNILEEPGGRRKWVFDTPRGEFQVQYKVRNPVWIKPDWAFIEEGKAIPEDSADRVEEGVLGEYALGIGNGYFIHGTLYKRMLGRNITHGCVRVDDEDLKFVYQAVTIGTPVYIF